MNADNLPALRPRSVVTVFADASYDEELQIAGWAGYIVYGQTARPLSGVVRSKVRDSCHAELAALGNVIYTAAEYLNLSHGDEIVATSDSEHALKILAGRSLVRPDRIEDVHVLDVVRRLLEERGVTLSLVHVKGHQSRRLREPVVLLQRACDMAARTALVQYHVRSTLAELVAA